ncbi:hypothetical protein OF83DRAFT_166289 [Amylostereum chailletii]|nr:hypothetical protein OF83DRAFT_166289 [Amylostereum chailletii]
MPRSLEEELNAMRNDLKLRGLEKENALLLAWRATHLDASRKACETDAVLAEELEIVRMKTELEMLRRERELRMERMGLDTKVMRRKREEEDDGVESSKAPMFVDEDVAVTLPPDDTEIEKSRALKRAKGVHGETRDISHRHSQPSSSTPPTPSTSSGLSRDNSTLSSYSHRSPKTPPDAHYESITKKHIVISNSEVDHIGNGRPQALKPSTTAGSPFQSYFSAFQCSPILVDSAHFLAPVTRSDLRSIFGGSLMTTRVAHSRDLNFLHARVINLPFLPTAPGAPGLVFYCGGERSEWPAREELFVNLANRKQIPTAYKYMGTYEHVDLPRELRTLTRKKWLALPYHTRAQWGRYIARVKTHDARLVRARTFLRTRNHGEEPSIEEVAETYGKAEAEDANDMVVRTEYDCGRERLSVFGLRCMGYNEQLVDTIKSKLVELQDQRGEEDDD